MVGEASYQVYKLAETTIVADMITEPKALAVASARVQSMMGAALVLGNLFGGLLATLNPRWPYFLGTGAVSIQISLLAIEHLFSSNALQFYHDQHARRGASRIDAAIENSHC